MWAALRAKCLTSDSARWRCRLNTTIRGEALGDETVDHGAGPAAGAEDHGLAGHLLLADEAVEGHPEARHVGVVADQPLALAGDRVDRAGRVRLLGQAVDQRDDLLLVGDRDVRAEERRRRAARRSRRRAPSAGDPTARRWRRCRGRRRPPAASRPTANGRPDGRSGPRAWSCSHPFEFREEAGVRDRRARRCVDRRRPPGDETRDGERHRQPVVVEAAGSARRSAVSARRS